MMQRLDDLDRRFGLRPGSRPTGTGTVLWPLAIVTPVFALSLALALIGEVAWYWALIPLIAAVGLVVALKRQTRR